MKTLFQKSNKKDENIKKQYKKIYNRRIFLFLCVFFIIGGLIVAIVLSKRNQIDLHIKKKIYLEISNFIKNEKNTLLISNEPKTYIQLSQDKILRVFSENNIFFKNNLSRHFKNIIKLPTFQNRQFSGPTPLLVFNEKEKKIQIVNNFKFLDESNKKFYIKGSDVNLDIKNNDCNSSNNFIFNDRDFYLKGDSFFSREFFSYIKITGNMLFKKRQKTNSEEFENEISSNIAEIFYDKNIIELTENIKMFQSNSNNYVKSNAAKIVFNSEHSEFEIKEMLFLNNVILSLIDRKTTITSDLAYYSSDKNLMFFFNNVKIKNNSIISKANYYIYNPLTEEGEVGDLEKHSEDVLSYNFVKRRVKFLSNLEIKEEKSSRRVQTLIFNGK